MINLIQFVPSADQILSLYWQGCTVDDLVSRCYRSIPQKNRCTRLYPVCRNYVERVLIDRVRF